MNFYSLYFPAFGLKLPIGTAETDGKAYPLQTHELLKDTTFADALQSQRETIASQR
jgi:hypothetical protein